MGEYAKFNGQRIKIGTCEDMYYLRADQALRVQPESGNVKPASAADQKVIRFRFPWPDEDNVQPGEFDPYERAVTVPDATLKAPEGVEHHAVQFIAQAGYNVCLPCPESPQARHDLKIHRNGFAGAVRIVQQGYRNGHLAVILTCGGCGTRWNLPTWADAEPVIVAIRAQADERERRGESAKWFHAVADRIAAGYGVVSAERSEAASA